MSAGCSVFWLGQQCVPLGEAHEVAEIIKSSFEHMEIEVCGSSQEREPIVIWRYCDKILQKGLGWATDQGETMTMTNATKEVLSKKIIRG